MTQSSQHSGSAKPIERSSVVRLIPTWFNPAATYRLAMAVLWRKTTRFDASAPDALREARAQSWSPAKLLERRRARRRIEIQKAENRDGTADQDLLERVAVGIALNKTPGL